MILSPPGGWSSLEVTGQAPPPCSHFTLTTVGEKLLCMVQLEQHQSSVGRSVECPQARYSHAATHLSGPLFVIMGGFGLADLWLCDTATKLWKMVLFLGVVLCVH